MNQNIKTVGFIKNLYGSERFIPLHEPVFMGKEKEYVADCIDSTFVSSVGEYVTRFESLIAEYTGAKHAIATVNGTAALHAALLVGGVEAGDEVITQSLTFIATLNAINYCGAQPVFIDVDRDTMGLSAEKLEDFFCQKTHVKADGQCYNKVTGKRIRACVPMHTFGHPCRIDAIREICNKFGVILVEDSAESLGSLYKERHTGTYGAMGVFSFNGNKVITTGGGGMIVTDDDALAQRLKHITTTAKVSHPYEYVHDMIGFNYRMPNLNAALGVAQMEYLPLYLEKKRKIAAEYEIFFRSSGIGFVTEPDNSHSNYWLNALAFNGQMERDAFLEYTNANGVMTRPVWKLMHRLEMFKQCQHENLENAEWLEARIVNIPSGVVHEK